MQNIILILFITAVSLVQVSCKSPGGNSVLVIALDELTINDISCSESENRPSGFDILCKESVRFTHAFTPSTLAVPAVTSLMTGLYPFQHKIHHNGGPGLSAEFETAAELAIKQGYRTSFFSGGAPVFRKSGLNQGFEIFEDNIVPTLTKLFRPFKKNADSFIQWLHQDLDGDPFFSVIYVPDLLFTTNETVSDVGETRNLSIESQLDELDETLYELFKTLKSVNRWDSTTIIISGLNGHTSGDRPKEPGPLNLHGENTQIALFIKPSQPKKRDEAIHWKIDQNVSLVDVGKTLFELLGQSNVESTSASASFPVQSLISALKNPNSTWNEDRPLLIESGWAFWHNAGPIRNAAISGHVLFIKDEKPLLYNTLVDRFEINPLPILQESVLPITQHLQQILDDNRFPPFIPLQPEWMSKISIPFMRWMKIDQEPYLLRDLKRLNALFPRSLDILNWTAQIAVNQKDWITLRALGIKNKMSLWQYVAEKNSSNKISKVNDSCFLLLSQKPLGPEMLKTCDDYLFLELVDWIRADDRGLDKETQRNRFLRSFRNYLLDQQIQRTNIAAGLIWHTSKDNVFAPSRSELALNLPEYSKLKNQIFRYLQSEEY